MKKAILPLLCAVHLTATARTDTTYKTYYGLLHAHTMICDGSGTPEEAYIMARNAGLHFFAITPHNHIEAESGAKERKDGVLIAKDNKLYNGTAPVTVTRKWRVNGAPYSETITLKPLLMAAQAQTNKNFVALYGQEYSTISSGNHVNVLGVKTVLKSGNGNYRQLLAELAAQNGPKPVIQLNHPEVENDLVWKGGKPSDRAKMYNDYGIDAGDLGPDFRTWVAAMQPYTHLIEVLSGPAMEQAPAPGYRYNDNENDYFFYLTQGLHVSPSAGQDNHYKTWGTVTDARTGILARSLTANALYDAMRRGRTFVTEDKNLTTALYVNDSLMGATLPGTVRYANIKVYIKDADEPNATYDVYVYGATIAPTVVTDATPRKAASALLGRTQVRGNGLHTIKGINPAGGASFMYIRVAQAGGDRAWTAPIWLRMASGAPATTSAASAMAEAPYFWSGGGNSKVYHVRGCAAISQIKADNMRTGNTPPKGRTQHKCDVR